MITAVKTSNLTQFRLLETFKIRCIQRFVFCAYLVQRMYVLQRQVRLESGIMHLTADNLQWVA
jgi:hypothetical protein